MKPLRKSTEACIQPTSVTARFVTDDNFTNEPHTYTDTETVSA